MRCPCLKRYFTNQHPRQRAEDLLQATTQSPNESITCFVDDVLRLGAPADPQTTEEMIRVLMKGVKSDIFGDLVPNPPMRVDGFVAEATSIERVLVARASNFRRLAGVATASSTATSRIILDDLGIGNLREVIRDVIKEKLKKLRPTADKPASLSIAEIVRDEVQGALQPEVPLDAASPVEPSLTYATAARRKLHIVARQVPATPQREAPADHYTRHQEERSQRARLEPPVPRKTNV